MLDGLDSSGPFSVRVCCFSLACPDFAVGSEKEEGDGKRDQYMNKRHCVEILRGKRHIFQKNNAKGESAIYICI